MKNCDTAEINVDTKGTILQFNRQSLRINHLILKKKILNKTLLYFLISLYI